MDIRIPLKVKNLLPSCEGRQVVPKKNVIELLRGLYSVTSASSLPFLAVQWGTLNMDISPILVF